MSVGKGACVCVWGGAGGPMRGPEQLCLEFKLSYKLSHRSLNSRVWGGGAPGRAAAGATCARTESRAGGGRGGGEIMGVRGLLAVGVNANSLKQV